MFVQLKTNWYVNIYSIRQIRDMPNDDRIIVWLDMGQAHKNILGEEFSGDDRQRILKAISLYCPNQEPRS